MTDLVTTESQNVLAGIMRAVADPAVDATKLHSLLDFQERLMATHARQAFNRDFLAMQDKLPNIPERGEIKISANAKGQKYALFEDIQDAIKPVLQQFGFSISYRTSNEGESVLATTILKHRDGHEELTTIALPKDKSGSKNETQAIGSSISYGFRYGTRAILGLRMGGIDDNAQATNVKYITPSQQEALKKALGPFEDEWLVQVKMTSVGDIHSEHFDRALAAAKKFAAQK